MSRRRRLDSLEARVVGGARAVVVPITVAWLEREAGRAQARALHRTREVALQAGAARPPVRFLLWHAFT